MKQFFNYYEILKISINSTQDQIKSAFRKMALIYHPDKNNNSPESTAKFILIHNAYSTLINNKKRKEYDDYINNSSVFSKSNKNSSSFQSVLPGKSSDYYKSNQELLSHLNFLLWDIEDLIFRRNQDNKIINQYILKMLTFIDKWILIPAGYPDYFMEARKKENIDPMEYINMYNSNMIKKGHLPFVSITDYFYDIRKRMNKFLKKMKPSDLFTNIKNSNIRLIDSIIETQNYIVHYLSYLLKNNNKNIEDITDFIHSNSIYTN